MYEGLPLVVLVPEAHEAVASPLSLLHHLDGSDGLEAGAEGLLQVALGHVLGEVGHPDGELAAGVTRAALFRASVVQLEPDRLVEGEKRMQVML